METEATNKIHVSAFSDDYNEKCFVFYYGQQRREYVPKSQTRFVEDDKGNTDFGKGIKSRWFEMPLWLAKKLQGTAFYTFS